MEKKEKAPKASPKKTSAPKKTTKRAFSSTYFRNHDDINYNLRPLENGTAKDGPSTSNGTNEEGVSKKEIDDVFTNIDKLDNKKRESMTIEKMYQKKTQLEHILLRPDTYIGSVEYCDKMVELRSPQRLLSLTFIPAHVGVRPGAGHDRGAADLLRARPVQDL